MGFVSQKLRDSARGQQCTLQIYTVCNHDPETTVLAHLPSDVSGMATKSDDFFAVYACSNCHSTLDNRLLFGAEPGYCLRALQRTHRIMFELGLLKIAGDKEKKFARSSKTVPRNAIYQHGTLLSPTTADPDEID